MKFRMVSLIAATAMFAAASVRADVPADISGAKLSVASVVVALQEAGFQAVPLRVPQMPDAILGIIATGINGTRASVLVTKCENAQTDEVCALTFMVSFDDDKHVLTDALLQSINEKTIFVKAIRGVRPTDHVALLNVSYSYMVKDMDDTKFLVPLIRDFGHDVGRAATIYSAAIQQNQPGKKSR